MVLSGMFDALYGMPRARIVPRERVRLSAPAERGRGTMRSMVERASALRQASRFTPLPPRKGAVPLPAIAGRDEAAPYRARDNNA